MEFAACYLDGGTLAAGPAPGLPTGAPVARIHGYGHYIETYVREKDGHWRIQHLRLVRLLVENG